jgi:hypothetical protein
VLFRSPYSFVLGLVTRWTGLDSVTVLGIAAMANLGVILGGVWYFARSLSRAVHFPSVLLVLTLLAWGWIPWRWAGYPNLNSLGTVLPLGSSFAYGTVLIGLGALWRWLNGPKSALLVLTVAAFAVTMLTHQATALWGVLIAAGFLASRVRQLTPRVRGQFALAVGCLGCLVVIWPFYSVLSLLSGLGGYDEINAGTYSGIVARSFLAVPGVLVLVRKRWWHETMHLRWAISAVSCVWLLGLVADKGSLGRVMPGMMLMSHTALAGYLVEIPHATGGPSRRQRLALLAMVVVVGMAGTATGWLRAVPRDFVPASMAKQLRLHSYFDPNRAFADYIGPTDVVAAVDGAAIPIGGYAGKVISVEIPEPFVRDVETRLAENRELTDPVTSADRRRELVEKYALDWIVVEPADASAITASLNGASIRGDVNGFTLIFVG